MSRLSGAPDYYIEGLQNLRSLLTEVENDLEVIKKDFCSSPEFSEDEYEQYLLSVNYSFLEMKKAYKIKSVRFEELDSEVKLVALLNKVRGMTEYVQQTSIDDITKFWDQIKQAMGAFKTLILRFRGGILKKLQANCVSYGGIGNSHSLTLEYADEVLTYERAITNTLVKAEALMISFSNKLDQGIFTSTSILKTVLMACDHKAFPIIRFIPDVVEKMKHVIDQSKRWLDRDEMYVLDVSTRIREARHNSRQKKKFLKQDSAKKRELTKDTSKAYATYTFNKKRLSVIEHKLEILDDKIQEYIHMRDNKTDEKKQKEGMVTFLDISISQTNKNYNLQLKRGRLLKQLDEIEKALNDVEEEIARYESRKDEATLEKAEAMGELAKSHKDYEMLKKRLKIVTLEVMQLSMEMSEISESIQQLETIQNLKTSPEKVDELLDKPPPPKLSQSLQDKIRLRRKRLFLTQEW